MTEKKYQQLASLSRFLSARRALIIKAWRAASDADPRQTTGDGLPQSEFKDHIPLVLEALEKKLVARPGEAKEKEAEEDQKIGETQHGIQRWQQGYRLPELTREWGHLHLCLHRELERFAKENSDLLPGVLAEAQEEVISVISEAINESLAQYVRMEQEEASRRARELETALAELEEMDLQRSELIRQAVHDLGGSVHAVTTAAGILSVSRLTDEKRTSMAGAVESGVRTLRMMLRELTSLARLEAGEKRLNAEPFDASQLLVRVAEIASPVAEECGLWLRTNGPETLEVEGDAEKVHRIVQNLLQNALKYTEEGGVEVTWGLEGSNHWWVIVKDTGPGLSEGSSKTSEGTKVAEDDQDQGGHADPGGAVSGNTRSQQSRSHPGEGIGLMIVKRLCDLLEATFEIVDSSPEGSKVRVIFPIAYKENSI